MSTRHAVPWFLPVVGFHPFRSRVLAGARLLLGPLCTLSPRGETSCSSSLRIFRLQLTWSLHFYLSCCCHAFFLCFTNVDCVRPKFCEERFQASEVHFALLEVRAGRVFAKMRPQHFCARNLSNSWQYFCDTSLFMAGSVRSNISGWLYRFVCPTYQYSFNSFHQNIMCSFLLLFSFYLYISVARALSLRPSLSFSAASEGILHSWTVGTLFCFACSTSLATCTVVLARRTLARYWNKRIHKRPLCYF